MSDHGIVDIGRQLDGSPNPKMGIQFVMCFLSATVFAFCRNCHRKLSK